MRIAANETNLSEGMDAPQQQDEPDCNISSALESLEADSYVEENEPKESNISKAETKLVARSRVVFVIFLAVVAILMGVTAFRVLRAVEEGDFATRFDDFARQVIEVSQINANNIFARYQSMALQMTADNLKADGSSNWPFVQMQGFEAQAAATVNATGAAYIAICPIVQDQQRVQYEAFAMNNRQWLQDTLDYYDIPKNASDLPLSPVFYSVEPETRGIDERLLPFHVPVAQISSAHVLSIVVNADIATDDFTDVAFDIMNSTRGGVMTTMTPAKEENLPQFGSLPGSYLVQPIFESYDQNSRIVGIFTGFLFWSKNFEKLLPKGSEPLILVVENCEALISFEIRGPQVTYLGAGEGFHDTKYDVYERKGRFVQYQSSTGCEFLLRIYPTAEFEAAYRTNSPLTKTSVVVGCFIMTALFFALYNVIVEYRQKKLVTDAKKNSALVGSLFPETVRDRLVEYTVTKKNSDLAQGENSSDVAAPIADCFECATVYFADISGFTAWSSSREPAEVFILLETLYNEFDLIARRMGVFKVETIGDCYMAVTGLPTVRDDHAVVMVRFARHCLSKMSQLLPRLEETLGEGTLALSMRVGIHSGPVTAGVLRGEKSRFQLFGDTVNVASRMESNGKAGRIHVSEATANELIRFNKADWISSREDTIVAKGKGEMNTYFINFVNSATTVNFSTEEEDEGI